jgi:hypothetical protein
MTNINRKGFVLLVVIMTLAMLGTQTFILTSGSNTMLFESNNAYLEASRRNLTASALAWAKKSLKNQNSQFFNKETKLNLDDIELESSSLSVIIEKVEDKNAQVQVNVSVSRGRQTINHRKKYRLEL